MHFIYFYLYMRNKKYNLTIFIVSYVKNMILSIVIIKIWIRIRQIAENISLIYCSVLTIEFSNSGILLSDAILINIPHYYLYGSETLNEIRYCQNKIF